MKTYGVYIGKFNPVHNGHIRTIQSMLDAEYDDYVIFIGSCNSPLMFNYFERKTFIKNFIPNMAGSIIGLPDYKHIDNNPYYSQWFENMFDILRFKWGHEFNYKKDLTFYGGKKEDVDFLLQAGMTVKIIDRNVLNISSCEVRRRLEDNESIKGLVPDKIENLILDVYERKFKEKWHNN